MKHQRGEERNTFVLLPLPNWICTRSQARLGKLPDCEEDGKNA